MEPIPSVNLRQAVRALMIDPTDRVLLVQLSYPDWTGWLLPGGGLEAGEDHVAALHRELAEETGVPRVFLGPPVWHRRYVRQEPLNGFHGQEELVFLVPCHHFEVAPALSPEELRAEGMVGFRWWSVAELVDTDERIIPHNLAELVTRVLDHGAPPEPLILDERGP